jgi:hypothetical protein
MQVDDGTVFSTSPSLTSELRTILTTAYGAHKDFPLTWTWTAPLTSYCTLRYTRTPNGSWKVDMGPHIRKFMDPLPGALTPTQSDFFDPPTNPIPVDPKLYQSTQGGLVFYTPIRSGPFGT